MNEISISAVGDLMLSDSFYRYKSGVASSLQKQYGLFIDPEIRNIFRSSDIAFGNIECVLSKLNQRINSLRSQYMRGMPEFAEILSEWGFNVLNVANNHILEQGLDAAIDSVEYIQRAGIKVVGAGKDYQFKQGYQTEIISLNNQRVAFVCSCFVNDPYAYRAGTEQELVQYISHIKHEVDIIIVSLHWGKEYINRPMQKQRDLAKQLVNAGARLILGHHPHVYQGVERIMNSLVIYSLGNFISDQPHRDTRWSAILNCTLNINGIISWNLFPFEIGDNYRPILCNTDNRLHDEILSRNSMVSTEQSDDGYLSDAIFFEKKARKEIWIETLKTLIKAPPTHGFQVLSRPIMRRLKQW